MKIFYELIFRIKKYLTSLNRRWKSVLPLLVTTSALAGGAVAVTQILGMFKNSNPITSPENTILATYTEDWIPLTYESIKEFRTFLEKNDRKNVRINSSIAIDLATPTNQLVHELCRIDVPDEPTNEQDKENSYFIFGLPKFSDDFNFEALEESAHDSKTGKTTYSERVLQNFSCLDTLRIELIYPRSLRSSYGGTGTHSLPLRGLFQVTMRAFSGPRIEYTLRQIEQ